MEILGSNKTGRWGPVDQQSNLGSCCPIPQCRDDIYYKVNGKRIIHAQEYNLQNYQLFCLCLYVRVSVYVLVHIGIPEKEVQFLGAEVTGSCEPFNGTDWKAG